MPMVLLRRLLGLGTQKNAVPSPCDSSLHASRAYRIPTAAALEAVVMGKPRVKPNYRRRVLFDEADKERLELMCRGVSPRFALGYRGLATMVVLYRNAPNTVPAILRGSLNQTPFSGIFPRTTDLPVRRVE